MRNIFCHLIIFNCQSYQKKSLLSQISNCHSFAELILQNKGIRGCIINKFTKCFAKILQRFALNEKFLKTKRAYYYKIYQSIYKCVLIFTKFLLKLNCYHENCYVFFPPYWDVCLVLLVQILRNTFSMFKNYQTIYIHNILVLNNNNHTHIIFKN